MSVCYCSRPDRNCAECRKDIQPAMLTGSRKTIEMFRKLIFLEEEGEVR